MNICVNNLPPKYRQVFAGSFSNFNQIQAELFDPIINNDKTLGNMFIFV